MDYNLILMSHAEASRNPPKILLNNTQLTFPDAQPFIDVNKRIQVPVRVVAEAIGANVEWDEKRQIVTLHKYEGPMVGDITRKFYIGKNYYDIIGGYSEGTHKMDTTAVIKNGRLYIPVWYLGKAMYTRVNWDYKFNRVYLYPEWTRLERDPIVGYMEVEINTQFVEYGVSFVVGDNVEYVKARQNVAEKMIAERYGTATAKKIMDYARKKLTREYTLPMKIFKVGSTEVRVSGSGISTEIFFYK